MTPPSDEIFIILSDDALLYRNLTQAARARARIVVCADTGRAVDMKGAAVRGILVDGSFVATRPLHQLARLREAYPLANILFVAMTEQLALLNQLQPLRIEILMRPLPLSSLATFIERALTAGKLSGQSVRAWIGELATECRLNVREVGLMPLVMEAETAEATRSRLGLDQRGLDRSLRRLVKKCRVRNVDRLAKNIMRDALLFSRSGAAELIEPMADHAASF